MVLVLLRNNEIRRDSVDVKKRGQKGQKKEGTAYIFLGVEEKQEKQEKQENKKGGKTKSVLARIRSFSFPDSATAKIIEVDKRLWDARH